MGCGVIDHKIGIMACARGASVEFFTHRWCPFAHRVWLCLEELQVPYREIQIDLYGGKPKWFLELNPKGLVPVLRDDKKCVLLCRMPIDHTSPRVVCPEQWASMQSTHLFDCAHRVICESVEICKFLAHGEESSSGSLVSADRWINYSSETLLPVGKQAVLEGNTAKVTELLTPLSGHLDSHDFFGGCLLDGVTEDLAPGVADFVLFPMVWRLHERGYVEDIAETTGVRSWVTRMVERPAVKKTLTTDWWWWW